MDFLWIVIIALLLFWLLGVGFSVGGNLVHVLLVIALIVVIVKVAQGRRIL